MARVLCPDDVLDLPQTSSASRVVAQVVEPSGVRQRRWRLVGQLARLVEFGRGKAARLAQRRRMHAEILRAAPLVGGERALGLFCDDAGGWLVATERALYHQVGEAWPRIGWEQVTRVDWDDARDAFLLSALTSDRAQHTAFRLATRDALVELARERVASTFLLSTDVRLAESGGAVVSARRQPGSDHVLWQVTLDRRGDMADPANRAEVQAALTDMRSHVGV